VSRPSHRARRGETGLVSLVVALVVVTSVAVAGVVAADAALADARRTPVERHAAGSTADRLASSSNLTVREGVFAADVAADLTPALVDRLASLPDDAAVAVRLDGRRLVSVGDPDDGLTVRRALRVAAPRTVERTVPVDDNRTVELDARTERVLVDVEPANDTTVHTVRANGRVALYDPNGTAGTSTVELSRFEPATLSFHVRGNATASATLRYRTAETRPALLEVTVDVD
jgi:hypothetical protein